MFWKDTHNIGCPWENKKVGIETRSRVFKCVSSWHLEQQGNTTGASLTAHCSSFTIPPPSEDKGHRPCSGLKWQGILRTS